MSTAETAHVGLKDQLVGLDNRFWIVNVMEMFERLAYYGVRAVASIYIVLAVSEGGPEFTHVQKGIIYAWWAGVQSVLPMFTGGFADRYGHKNTIAVAIVLKCIGYALMGTMMDFPGFFWGCMFLAGGTAIFKPGVQGTLAATLKSGNASLGWGIFYQLVNIGGFLGPVIAGVLRLLAWKWVFFACAGIVCINFLWLPFYKDPTQEEGFEGKGEKGAETWGALSRSVGKEMAIIWGVVLAAITPYLVWRDWSAYSDAMTKAAALGSEALITAAETAAPYNSFKVETLAALIGLVAFAIYVPRKAHFDKGSTDPLTVFAVSVVGLFQPRVLAFCIVFSGFWLMFNQVFDLLPNMIDDWVDTSGLIASAGSASSGVVVPGIVSLLLGVVLAGVAGIVVLLAMRPDRREAKDVPWNAYIVVGVAFFAALGAPLTFVLGGWALVIAATVGGAAAGAAAFVTRLPAKVFAAAAAGIGLLGGIPLVWTKMKGSSAELTQMAADGAQVPPEWMINLNPALIVFTMIFFAYLTSFVRPLTSIIIGMVVATAGSILAGTATVGIICIAGIAVFSIGEMLSSPKKMEYLASLAKKGQEGLFMGYANIPVAIGWIAGSYLAGDAYEQGGDKANLARKYLIDEVGMDEAKATAIDRADTVSVLSEELGKSAMEVQQLLYAHYDPQTIWINIGIIGLISVALMIGYDRVMRVVNAREAKGA